MIHKVIVGLGNPGPRFEGTRHNAGFCVLDLLAGGKPFQRRDAFNADLLEQIIGDQLVLLLKPLTFMNDSGKAVAAALRHHDLSPGELLVVHDDVSLPMGKLRFQQGGSAGGQHGVESIIEELGGVRGFARLKLGVGPDPGGSRRFEFVLAPVEADLAELLGQELAVAAQSVRVFMADGIQAAMRCFNGIDLRA